MKRLTREDIHTRLYTALRTAPKPLLSRLRSSLPHEADKAADELAALLARQVDGPGICVVQANIPSGKYQPGRFGEDEPWPADLSQSPAPPQAL